MRHIGYSTGAIDPRNLDSAVQKALSFDTGTFEVSALRFDEFDPALNFIEHLAPCFDISFHVPSAFSDEQESHITARLLNAVKKRPMHLILHPDAIRRHARWRPLNGHVCIENMDPRKPVGRDVAELMQVFERLPEARMCFDIGHAHILDRTLSLAYEILTAFADRIVEIHASEVTDSCRHVPTTWATRNAYHRLVSLFPSDATVIIESEVKNDSIDREFSELKKALEC